jgi:hypothetical protein
MENEMRQMIDKVKNFRCVVNERKGDNENCCDHCGYQYQTSADKRLHKDIIDMMKNGLSDSIIEARMYGKYKYRFSMKDINNMIDKAKEHLSKNNKNF